MPVSTWCSSVCREDYNGKHGIFQRLEGHEGILCSICICFEAVATGIWDGMA
jgi:hypothetical protein